MKKKENEVKAIMLSVATLSVVLMSGCTTKGPISGWVDNDVKPVKTGMAEHRACVFFYAPAMTIGPIAGLPAGSDLTIGTAMKNGGITKVHHIDFEVESNFPLIYTRLIVHGE